MDKSITFLFMDYETFNRNPKGGRASQFASLRTNYDLEIIPSSALNIFCEQTIDNIPSPTAALITKITPQKIERIKKGTEQLPKSSFPIKPVVYNEYWFINRILEEMSVSSTCTLGYNSFKFDDEFTRNLLYRNLHDPYSREYRNNNSRFDVYYLVVAAYVLKPHLLKFPNAIEKETKEPLFHSKTNLPLPSFRLEDLSVANGILHLNAHDAFSDVEATVDIMKKIKEGDEFFFEEMFALRKKNNVAMWLSKNQKTPIIHISPYYGKENYSLGILVQINTRIDETLCLNLAYDVEPLLSLEGTELENYLFPKDGTSYPKITVKIRHNQCPMLANLKEYKDRLITLQVDMSNMRKNLDLINENLDLLKNKLSPLYFNRYPETPYDIDSDLKIYFDFFSDVEQIQMSKVHHYITTNKLPTLDYSTLIPRIEEMVFKLKARNFPDFLTENELIKWKAYSKERITNKSIGAELVLEDFYNELESLYKQNLSDEDIKVLIEIEEYVSYLKEVHSIESKPNVNKLIENTIFSSSNEIILDPEITALKLEISKLENLINELDNEKNDIEKQISDFQFKHTKYLGEIILEILNLRKILAKDNKEKYQEACQDEEEYKEQFNEERKKVKHEITKEEDKELKKLYRKASMLSHPDKYSNESDEVKNLANEIFKDLNEANQQNDIKRVYKILDNLEKGILQRTLREKLDDKKILKALIITLKNKVTSLTAEVLKIKESDIYKTLIEIQDFDSYFNNIKEKLQNEILELKKNS